MEIKRATSSDTETLFEIRCSVRENHESREGLAAIGITPESVSQMLDTDCAAWIADEDGLPVAFSMANGTKRTVFAMFVRPGYEGRGHGRRLMRRAEVWLAEQGVTKPWLTTSSNPDIRAHGFYLRLGWNPEGLTDDGQIRYVKELVEG